MDPDQVLDVELQTLDVGFDVRDVRIKNACLTQLDAGSGAIKTSCLQDIDLNGAKLRAVQLVDLFGERLDAANGDWGGARIRRARFTDCRLTGLSLAEASIEQVGFRSCKLDYANFRHCDLASVSFEDCLLAGADFQGAKIAATRFAGCRLVDADFSRAELSQVDLRGSELAPAGSLLSLAGAIIDPLQLMELARPLAHELGMTVEER